MWSLFLGLPNQSVVRIEKVVIKENSGHTAVPFRNYVIVYARDGMKVLDVTLQKW